MFTAPDDLKNYLNGSSSIDSQSLITAEWNLNIPNNILMVGNYRYRPTDVGNSYSIIASAFNLVDAANEYTGATDSKIINNSGYTSDDSNNNPIPVIFQSLQQQRKLLFSLDDCLKRFRPRSGINKMMYISNKNYINFLKSDSDLTKRPRYYPGNKEDSFKYWNSFRIEDGIARGISVNKNTTSYDISDTAPFVVYNNPVPANRIIIKMQTNTGILAYDNLVIDGKTVSDPFYGNTNKTIPKVWKIQYLDASNNWQNAYQFSGDQSVAAIGSDGYLELQYGLSNIPSQFSNNFVYAKDYANTTALPQKSITGYAYLVGSSSTSAGTYYVWNGSSYTTFVPIYGWYINNESYGNVNGKTQFVNDLTSPSNYTNNGSTIYKELQYIKGLRLVIDSMNKPDCTFDLIEMSPRLNVNLTDKTVSVSANRSNATLGAAGLPVGELFASTGSLEIFDYDESFNSNNPNSILNIKDGSSIVSSFSAINLQVKLYETIFTETANYTVPIKTLYSDGFPQESFKDRKVSITLRDMFFYFENMVAPQLLIPDASLSFAISMLLDSIGFSNYVFKRIDGEKEFIIPYFIIDPNKTVAEILQTLAISSQSSMFFDEYNNFVVMSKDYLLPSVNERSATSDVDLVLYGSETNKKVDVTSNSNVTGNSLANIIEIASETEQIYNDGKINYNVMYIQKGLSSFAQQTQLDYNRNWVYAPVLLWEVTAPNNTKSTNEAPVSSQSAYQLSAIVLNNDIPIDPPYVGSDKKIYNNIIDIGMDAANGIYGVTRYNGYFYANGEILRYDAVEYTTGDNVPVWISSVSEYQNYFSKIKFNGKLYPTGKIRIFTEPFYNADGTFKPGAVSKHGRAQFGTTITSHTSKIDSSWTDKTKLNGCFMKSEYLFGNTTINTTQFTDGTSGKSFSIKGKSYSSDDLSKGTETTGTMRNAIVVNHNGEGEKPDNQFEFADSGSIKSSALVLDGPTFSSSINPQDFMSYVYKELNDDYRHIGTRMRIIGSNVSTSDVSQTPKGGSSYYTTADGKTIAGAGGGLGILINPKTNTGYYLEISALSDKGASGVNDIFFYKIQKDVSSNLAIPVPLWKDQIGINVDPGFIAGSDRTSSASQTTTYDIAIEYKAPTDAPKGTLEFRIYVNDRLISTVTDYQALTKKYYNFALFNRGSARVMFENAYAFSNNYSENTSLLSQFPSDSVFEYEDVPVSNALRKYSFSGLLRSSLTGIDTKKTNGFKLYFEEFGTILRECAYFDIKYDKAYPALSARIAPTFTDTKGYLVSGFTSTAYGAEFLVFNCKDQSLLLDGKDGNWLRILGISFTQQGNHTLTLDEYFSERSDFSNVDMQYNNPLVSNKNYLTIKNSRLTYGKKDFSLDASYIQSQDSANELMGWMANKIMKPRKSVGLKVMYNPLIQLGDIINIVYTNTENTNGTYNELVGNSDNRFVVYEIDYSNSGNGPQMDLYLSELV